MCLTLRHVILQSWYFFANFEYADEIADEQVGQLLHVRLDCDLSTLLQDETRLVYHFDVRSLQWK